MGSTASVTITVQGAVVTVSVNTATLANTGTDAPAMGAIAIGLLALGGTAVFAGRRKQDS
ncbi:MAG: LPXTG cell wall anchor domain-containing protein [Antricoccus sp.]